MPDWCGFYNFYRAIIPDRIVSPSFGGGWGEAGVGWGRGVITCLFFITKMHRGFLFPIFLLTLQNRPEIREKRFFIERQKSTISFFDLKKTGYLT
jgi:hypothetical protein